MGRRYNRSRTRDTTLLSGWLFADLLLGLAVIFMVTAPSGSFAPLPPTLTSTLAPTYTPGPTYTPFPTFTPGPSQTPLPTYTPGPSQTPLPTYTPGPTQTPLPTYTPGPSQTPLPTYTPGPSPTPLPTYTPGPTQELIALDQVALSQEVAEFRLRTNADALLGGDDARRQQERERLRDEIRQQFANLQDQRAGIVLTFGVAPTPAEGGRISQEVNRLLRETLPDIFGDAVLRDFHNIEGDTQQRGVVEIEVYVIIGGD